MEIEHRKIFTTHEGVCHMFRMVTRQSDQKLVKRRGHFLIEHKKSLKSLDVPKSFHIYITPRNDWHGIVNGLWPGKHPSLIVDTSSYSLPLDVNVHLTSNHFYPFFDQQCFNVICGFFNLNFHTILMQVKLKLI